MSWISSNNEEEEEETQLLTQHLSQQLKTAVYTAPQSHHYHQSLTFIPENQGGHEVKERPTKTVSLFENSCKCWTWMKLSLIMKKSNLYDDLTNYVIQLKLLISHPYFFVFCLLKDTVAFTFPLKTFHSRGYMNHLAFLFQNVSLIIHY